MKKKQFLKCFSISLLIIFLQVVLYSTLTLISDDNYISNILIVALLLLMMLLQEILPEDSTDEIHSDD